MADCTKRPFKVDFGGLREIPGRSGPGTARTIRIQGEAAFARHAVAAAGTPKRIGTGAVSAVPFEDHFAKRETLGISPRMAAVKLGVSGSLIKEVSPVSRLCGTGAFSRSGSRAIVGFPQRSHNLGLVRREKSYERLGTPWSLDQELVATRLTRRPAT